MKIDVLTYMAFWSPIISPRRQWPDVAKPPGAGAAVNVKIVPVVTFEVKRLSRQWLAGICSMYA